VQRLLGIKPIFTYTRYAWIAFFLFIILDHACTTCFVFANSFEKSFQSPFANSQRYMNKIARSIFKIWSFLPLFQTKLPLNEILLLVFKRVLDINFERGSYQFKIILKVRYQLKTSLIPIERLLLKTFWNWWWCGPFALGYISPPLALIAKNWVFWEPLFTFSPNDKINMSEDYTKVESGAEWRRRVNNTDRVEWKPCLRRKLHFPFNLWLSIGIHLKTH
jgi:hypothetical protein